MNTVFVYIYIYIYEFEPKFSNKYILRFFDLIIIFLKKFMKSVEYFESIINIKKKNSKKWKKQVNQHEGVWHLLLKNEKREEGVDS